MHFKEYFERMKFRTQCNRLSSKSNLSSPKKLGISQDILALHTVSQPHNNLGLNSRKKPVNKLEFDKFKSRKGYGGSVEEVEMPISPSSLIYTPSRLTFMEAKGPNSLFASSAHYIQDHGSERQFHRSPPKKSYTPSTMTHAAVASTQSKKQLMLPDHTVVNKHSSTSRFSDTEMMDYGEDRPKSTTYVPKKFRWDNMEPQTPMIPYSTPGPKSTTQSHSNLFNRKSNDSKSNRDSKSFINLYNKPKDFPPVYSNINATPKLDTASDLQNMWVSEDFQGTPLKKYEDFRRRVEFCSDLDSIPESLYPSEPDAEMQHPSDSAPLCKPATKAISSLNKIRQSISHSEEALTLYQPELSTKAMKNPYSGPYQSDLTTQAPRDTSLMSYQPDVSSQAGTNTYTAPYQPEVSTQVVRNTYKDPYQPEVSTKVVKNTYKAPYQPEVSTQVVRNTYKDPYQSEVSTQVVRNTYKVPYQPEVSTEVVRNTYTASYQPDITTKAERYTYTPMSINEAPAEILTASTPVKTSCRANDSLFIQTLDSIKKEQQHDHIVPTLRIDKIPPIASLGEVVDNESPGTYWDKKKSVLLNEFDVKLPDSETEADLPCDAGLDQSSINQQGAHIDALTSRECVQVAKESGQIQELLEELNQLGDQSGSIAYDPCSGQSLLSKDEQDPDKKTSAGCDEPPDSYDTYSHSVPLFSQCSDDILAQVPQAEADTNLDSLKDAQINAIGIATETQLVSHQRSTTHLDREKMNADGHQSNENSSKNTSDQPVDVNTDTGKGSNCESLLSSSETQTEIKVFVDSATSPINIELLRTQLIPEETISNVQSNLVLNVKPIDATCYNYGDFRTVPEMPGQFRSEHVGTSTVISCEQDASRPCHVDRPPESLDHVNDQCIVTTNCEETTCGNYSLRSRVLK